MKFILIETGSGQKRQEVAIRLFENPIAQSRRIQSHRVRHLAGEGRKLHIQATDTPYMDRKWQTTSVK